MMEQTVNDGTLVTYIVEGNSVLHTAICTANTPLAHWLLHKGVSVNIQNSKRDTPLHYAALYGKLPLAVELLDIGANINATNVEGDTPLHSAIRNAHVFVAHQLLDRGALVNIQNVKGETPLHYAAHYGHLTLILKLLELGANINVSNLCGDTPLKIAIYNKSISLTRELLYKGASLDMDSPFGNIRIHCAILKFLDVPMIKILLQETTTIDIKNNFDETPLHLAVQSGNVPITEYLLDEKNASVHMKTITGNTPLHIAVGANNLIIIEKLLNKGSKVNEQNIFGDTPLHIAVSNKYQQLIRITHKNTIDINNSLCHTTLHTDFYKSICLAYLLLDRGARVNIKNKNGYTPIHVALMECYILHSSYMYKMFYPCQCDSELVHKLLMSTTDVDIELFNGNTPLHYAIFHEDLELAKKLLEKGAMTDMRNSNGNTPLYYATVANKLMLVKLLLDYRANVDVLEKVILSVGGIESAVRTVFRNHIIKLKVAGLHIDNILRTIRYNDELEVQCLAELELIKNTKISKNSSLAILFSNYSNPHYIADNERLMALEEIVHSSSLSEQFPNYAEILRNTLKKTKRRFDLRKLANQSLSSEQRKWCCQVLPYLVKEKILGYLTNEELYNLIKSECL